MENVRKVHRKSKKFKILKKFGNSRESRSILQDNLCFFIAAIVRWYGSHIYELQFSKFFSYGAERERFQYTQNQIIAVF